MFLMFLFSCSTAEKYFVLEKGPRNTIVIHKHEFYTKRIYVPKNVYDSTKVNTYIKLKERKIKKQDKLQYPQVKYSGGCKK